MRKNYQITAIEDGRKYWISPKVVITCFVIGEGADETIVLANRRSNPEDKINRGLWNCPCGYLEMGEKLVDCAQREVYEETGFRVPIEAIKPYKFIDQTPNSSILNILFVARVPQTDLYNTQLYGLLNPNSHLRGGELNETDAVELIKVSDLSKYSWAFKHDETIRTLVKR